jgi:dihydrofolate reductase
MECAIIVAFCDNGGIGKGNSIPWRIPEDMKHFKEITTSAPSGKRNAVIMGRKTWDSLPPKCKPLPNRLNIVLSRSVDVIDVIDGALVCPSMKKALEAVQAVQTVQAVQALDTTHVHQVFIIGGYSVYLEAMNMNICNKAYVTHVDGEYDCDAFFPIDLFNKKFVCEQESKERKGLQCRFALYKSI